MTCPNCGQEHEEDRCSYCGTPAKRSLNRLGAVLVLILLVLPSAAAGACSVLVTAGASTLKDHDALLYLIPITLACAAVFVGSIALCGKLWRS